jgi:hypothetical protein
MMSKEAMKLAKAWFERNTYGDEAVDVYEALCEALAEPQEKYQYGTPLLDAMRGKANEALDKMAENARELRLDYEPAQQEPPAWWPAVENILKEYGLQAIDFVADFKAALAEQPHEIGARLACEGKGISDLWGAVKSDADMAEAQRGYEAALAQQPAQQEPVAKKTRIGLVTSSGWDSLPVGTEFYTSPPAQRTWVGLSDEDIKGEDWVLSAVKEYEAYTLQEQLVIEGVAKFSYAIEAKLREKNT